jgi:hypothetical protein
MTNCQSQAGVSYVYRCCVRRWLFRCTCVSGSPTATIPRPACFSYVNTCCIRRWLFRCTCVSGSPTATIPRPACFSYVNTCCMRRWLFRCTCVSGSPTATILRPACSVSRSWWASRSRSPTRPFTSSYSTGCPGIPGIDIDSVADP